MGRGSGFRTWASSPGRRTSDCRAIELRFPGKEAYQSKLIVLRICPSAAHPLTLVTISAALLSGTQQSNDQKSFSLNCYSGRRRRRSGADAVTVTESAADPDYGPIRTFRVWRQPATGRTFDHRDGRVGCRGFRSHSGGKRAERFSPAGAE